MKPNNADGRSSVVLTRNVDDSVVELAVHGQWSRKTAVDVYRALRKSLTEHPAAIIIDLGDLNDLEADSAATWLAASRAAMTLHPPAQVALCAPPTRQIVTRLRQLGCTRFLSLFVTADQARAAVTDALLPTDRLQLRWLPPQSDTLAAVGDAVALACRVWDMPALTSAAQAVALDLVDDSMRHARTAMLFTISRRSRSLYLALCDQEPTLPPLRPPYLAAEDHRLPVLTTRGYVWGASTTHDGKVVRAVVHDN